MFTPPQTFVYTPQFLISRIKSIILPTPKSVSRPYMARHTLHDYTQIGWEVQRVDACQKTKKVKLNSTI